MQLKSFITTAILLVVTTVSYSQIVASISSIDNTSKLNTNTVTQLTNQGVDEVKNSKLTKVDYSASQEKLQIEASQSIQFMSLFKDGQDFLTQMPVFANNLKISMMNYESGEYELHLSIEGNAVPTIIEITKE